MSPSFVDDKDIAARIVENIRWIDVDVRLRWNNQSLKEAA